MRYTKILGLLAVAAAALMAFAGTASATTITSPTGTLATPTIHLPSEGHVTLANSNSNLECAWTIEGAIASHGSGLTAQVKISNFSITGCTGGWTFTANTLGTLEIHWTSGYNGTVTWTGTTIIGVLHTIFGDITCRYLPNSTDFGTLTGGNPATIDITASLPFHSGGGLCGSGASQLSGSLVTTSALYVDP
jgi:hypothetical protein